MTNKEVLKAINIINILLTACSSIAQDSTDDVVMNIDIDDRKSLEVLLLIAKKYLERRKK